MAPRGLLSDLYGDAEGWRARSVRASWSSVLLALLTLVAVFVARNVVIAASQPIGWVGAAAATALVISPIIELQTRWVPKVVAILLSLAVGVALALSVGAGVFLEVRDQLNTLQRRLPAAAQRLEERNGSESVVAQIDLSTLVDDVVGQVSGRLSPEPTIEGAVGTVPAFLVSGVLVIFFLVWGDDLMGGLARQISDPERRRLGREGVRRAVHFTQGYILSTLLVALAVTALGAVLAREVGLTTPLVLGVLLGATSVIPWFGVLFGSVPLLLLSAAFRPGWTTALLLVGAIALQAVTTLATRAIERRTLKVGPAVIVIAALLGSDLYGVGGALVALVGAVFAVALVDALVEEAAAEAPAPAPAPSAVAEE